MFKLAHFQTFQTCYLLNVQTLKLSTFQTSKLWAPPPPNLDAFWQAGRQSSWQTGGVQGGHAEQDHTNPGGAADPWPVPIGSYSSFKIGDNTFETKFAQLKEISLTGKKSDSPRPGVNPFLLDDLVHTLHR